MKCSVELVQAEGQEKYSIQDIGSRINAVYQAIKNTNPRGYLDEFESRIELIGQDIATELGADYDAVDTGKELVLIFDWSRTGGSLLRQRREQLLS